MAGRKKKLTGIEVGRLFIKDLLTEWEAEITALENGTYDENAVYPGLFTATERESMVATLKGKKEDLMYYQLFKRIHDVIMTYPKRFCMYRESVESRYWRVASLIAHIDEWEERNRFNNFRPIIMTNKEYTAYKQRKDFVYAGGVAILQEPLPEQWIDKKGKYVQPVLWDNSIEQQAKEHERYIVENLSELSYFLRECFVMQEAVKLISETIGIPEVNTTLSKFQDINGAIGLAEVLNSKAEMMINTITRFTPSRDIDEEATEAARNIARSLFKPIDIAAARPSKENIEQAREFINSNIPYIYTRTEAFHRIIRRGKNAHE